MTPEDESTFEKLAKAEKVIVALQALAKECVGEGFNGFADRIRDCVILCQNDYVTLHKALFDKASAKPTKPPGTTH